MCEIAGKSCTKPVIFIFSLSLSISYYIHTIYIIPEYAHVHLDSFILANSGKIKLQSPSTHHLCNDDLDFSFCILCIRYRSPVFVSLASECAWTWITPTSERSQHVCMYWCVSACVGHRGHKCVWNINNIRFSYTDHCIFRWQAKSIRDLKKFLLSGHFIFPSLQYFQSILLSLE